MAARVPTRLTPVSQHEARKQGRKFGFTVGLAFIALGLVLTWRHKPTAAGVLFAIGGVLVLAALVIPAQLGPVERAWMGLAHLMSKVTTPIFMAIVYFVVLTPTGLLRRSMGGTPIFPRDRTGSRWMSHPVSADVRGSMERQF
jgi:hypothetical protein